MKTKRNATIDIMKGIGIILVMLGHQNLPINTFIYSFHMPLFFIIGGYLYKANSILSSIKKDFRRLIIPYIFASSLIIGNELLMSIIKSDNSYVFNSIIASIYGSGQSYDGALFAKVPSIGAIWFLLALFWTKNIFNILHKYLNDKILFISCIVMSIAASYIDHNIANIPFSILPGVSALIFYYLGFHAKNFNLRSYYYLFCILIWFIAINYSHLYMVRCSFGCYPIDIIGACGGTIVVFLISKYTHGTSVKFSYIFRWFGVNSLAILCFHAFRINNNIWSYFGINNTIIIVLIKIFFPIILTLFFYHIKAIRNMLNIQSIMKE